MNLFEVQNIDDDNKWFLSSDWHTASQHPKLIVDFYIA
jgi:hypothetical protein